MLSDDKREREAVRRIRYACMLLKGNVLLNMEASDGRAVERYLESQPDLDETLQEARKDLAIARALLCIARSEEYARNGVEEHALN